MTLRLTTIILPGLLMASIMGLGLSVAAYDLKLAKAGVVNQERGESYRSASGEQ
jgi:hypothetical protein